MGGGKKAAATQPLFSFLPFHFLFVKLALNDSTVRHFRGLPFTYEGTRKQQSSEEWAMNNEKNGGSLLYSLIPLDEFKVLLGVDDREDKISRFCLVTATLTIEQYCKRKLLRKKWFEFFPFYGDYVFPLWDYPVREILAVYQTHALKEAVIIEPGFYHTIPDCGELEDIPFCLSVSSALRLVRELSGMKVHYRAGYGKGAVPEDLASACLELAAWNMSRYRGRRIGMTGAVRGSGKDGEHLESSMPENVRRLLEPYRRRVI
jgi:hypothetical protein